MMAIIRVFLKYPYMEKLNVGIAMSVPAIKRKCLGHVIQV